MPAARTLFRQALGLALALLLACAATAWAQPARESAVKAAFLYKFGSFVEWPPASFPRADAPLVIGVSGDDELLADLEQLTAGRGVEGRPVAVRKFPDNGPFAGAHILYLAPRREARLRDAVEAAAGPVLVVTSQAGGLQAGSVLNFVEDAGRVRFAASLASAEARQLKLSARLLSVAQAVEGRGR